jgi:hypothetical protein
MDTEELIKSEADSSDYLRKKDAHIDRAYYVLIFITFSTCVSTLFILWALIKNYHLTSLGELAIGLVTIIFSGAYLSLCAKFYHRPLMGLKITIALFLLSVISKVVTGDFNWFSALVISVCLYFLWKGLKAANEKAQLVSINPDHN